MIQVSEELEGTVLRLLLSRPKANILDAEMIGGIQRAVESAVTPATKLIVFEGDGRHFCFGASVAEHQADQAADMLSSFHGMFRALAEAAVPTCAVVRGQCLGGGLELASWCTWIVADPGAKLGQPEIRLAVFPPMASILLPWRVGGGAALDLCTSGRTISADEALRIGLITAISDDPEAWWRALVRDHLQHTSASSLRIADRAARVTLSHQLTTLLPELERLYLSELMSTHDANEGIAAFIGRRPPTYTNA